MEHEIAQEYVNYRLVQGWTLLQIAIEHKIPAQFDCYDCYCKCYIVKNIAREYELLNR